MKEELIKYIFSNGRFCPQPGKWHELWEMLPDKKDNPKGGWTPPLPLILGAWCNTPGIVKIARMQEHIEYAAEHGVLEKVDAFLRLLSEDEWFHGND